MEITGRIIQIQPLLSGQGKNGEWKRQEYILETIEQFPRKVCISVWGDKIDQFAVQQGETVTFSINIESRDYQGRWYTDVRAWAIRREAAQPMGAAQPVAASVAYPTDSPFTAEEAGGSTDDLPF